MDLSINITSVSHFKYVGQLVEAYKISANQRGTGIAVRKADYLKKKMSTGNAIIALDDGNLAGFCYIETFSSGKYVSNSGLIVIPEYRKKGLSREIKREAFNLAREKYPDAKIFGITTSSIVMKINAGLGYLPVALTELTTDDEFWNACSSCPNYDILQRHERKMCLCTGMLAPSKNQSSKNAQKTIDKDVNKNQ